MNDVLKSLVDSVFEINDKLCDAKVAYKDYILSMSDTELKQVIGNTEEDYKKILDLHCHENQVNVPEDLRRRGKIHIDSKDEISLREEGVHYSPENNTSLRESIESDLHSLVSDFFEKYRDDANIQTEYFRYINSLSDEELESIKSETEEEALVVRKWSLSSERPMVSEEQKKIRLIYNAITGEIEIRQSGKRGRGEFSSLPTHIG